MRTAVAPLNAHILKTRDNHSDFGADIKLHGNGGPFAIPNPYSSSKLHYLHCADYVEIESNYT